MKSRSRHILIVSTLAICAGWLAPANAATCDFDVCPYANVNNSIDNMKELITKGIEESVMVVKPVYDSRVKSYLRTYIERYPKYTERIIALSEIYFPLFEKYLAAYGLPTDLKFMAIVESGLQPSATSSVGAAGMWQFMPGTAQMMGLRINKYLDERRDPEKSTEAAVKYLKQLYEQFGSWELAMAGYNAGPGRVNYAIRKSGSRDYWTLQRYLPRETRSYVPGFIAANYVLTHYQQHGLAAAELPAEYTHTVEVTLYEGMSFSDINRVTGISTTMLTELNPEYSRRYVPSSVAGYKVVLPEYGVAALFEHLEIPDSEIGRYTNASITDLEIRPVSFKKQTVTHTYRVRSGDNLYRIAQNNGCSINDLIRWNGLTTTTIKINQRLKIKVTENVAVYDEEPIAKQRDVAPLAMISTTSTLRKADFGTIIYARPAQEVTGNVFPEFPDDAMILKRRMSIKDLMTVNDIPETMLPQYSGVTPGAVVRIQ